MRHSGSPYETIKSGFHIVASIPSATPGYYDVTGTAYVYPFQNSRGFGFDRCWIGTIGSTGSPDRQTNYGFANAVGSLDYNAAATETGLVALGASSLLIEGCSGPASNTARVSNVALVAQQVSNFHGTIARHLSLSRPTNKFHGRRARP